MDNDRLSKQLLYEELAKGQRVVGVQLKRYKDTVRDTLGKSHIRPANLQQLAADREAWLNAYCRGMTHFEEDRTQ